MKEKFKVVKFNNGKYGVINTVNDRFVVDSINYCSVDYTEIVEKSLGFTFEFCQKHPDLID